MVDGDGDDLSVVDVCVDMDVDGIDLLSDLLSDSDVDLDDAAGPMGNGSRVVA